MKHYWFEVIADDEGILEGEEFLVGAFDKIEAMLIAEDNFFGCELKCWGEVSEEEAEASGLDEY